MCVGGRVKLRQIEDETSAHAGYVSADEIPAKSPEMTSSVDRCHVINMRELAGLACGQACQSAAETSTSADE